MVPRVAPRLLAATFADISVPLNSGTCSNERLFPATKEEEANKKRIIDAKAEGQKSLKLKVIIVKTPRRSEAAATTLFLPNLPTTLPLTMLPVNAVRAIPEKMRDASPDDAWNLSLKDETP